ncbi:MAG: biosynthetic-type acetolactate synthase large subunit [bacterium]
MELTGAEIFMQSLIEEKVEVIFGIPGGVVLPIIDKLNESKIRFILTRHEQGAAHMADGYARSTGKTGVCFSTSGPGVTNLVTGLATAYMDSVPMVAFSGQVATNLIGNDAFQEADATGITRPVTKHNFLVKDVKDLANTIQEAFYIASTGRPGPVLVDLPVDVQKATTEFIYKEKAEIRSYKPTYTGHTGQIKKAADLINKSQKPVLYIGGGVVISDAHGEVNELAEKAEIPVTNTLMAQGVFPENNRLSLGMLGMHGTYSANMSMQNADLIIAVGSRFDDRITGRIADFAPLSKKIHIDIDPTSISKNVLADIPIVGDARLILKELIKLVKKTTHGKWIGQISEWIKATPNAYYKNDNALRPQYIIEQVRNITKGKAIVTTEVGQHQMWAAQFYKPESPRHFLTSGGLGTMGYGFPAGIGAKVANPKKDVFVIAGDGSIQMNIQELATAVLNKINVKVVILSNNFLGMVRQWQEMFYGRRYNAVCLSKKPECDPGCNKPADGCPVFVPDFVKVAEAYGACGMRITKKEDVIPALEKSLTIDNTVFMDFIIEKEENVFPMVPSGAALHEIITGLA